MFGQTIALAALGAAGAMAAPQMCACQPSDSALVSAAGISATPSAYGAAPTITSTITAHDTETKTITQAVETSTITAHDTETKTITQAVETSTITEHETKTQTITSMVDTSSSSIPVQTMTETETETVTSTVTSTVGATHTPQAPVVSSGSIRHSGSPYYPTYGAGNGTAVAGSTGLVGTAGVPQATGTSVSVQGYSSPARYSYPIPVGTGRPSGVASPSGAPFASGASSASPYVPLGTGYHSAPAYTPLSSGSRNPYVPMGTGATTGTPLADSTSAPYPRPYSVRPSGVAGPSGSAAMTPSKSSTAVPEDTTASSTPAATTASSTPAVTTSSMAASSPVSSTPAGTTSGSPQSTSVSNPTCFENGAGNKTTASTDGAPAAEVYQCYSGPASNFPASDKWVSYEDMKKVHAKLGQTYCVGGVLNTQDQTDAVFAAIDSVATASKVDSRVILSQIIQESGGCVNVPATNNGVNNPGLMQTHNGVSFVGNDASKEDQAKNILQMVSDGVQGTHYKADGGDGLVQTLDRYGNIYTAARAYNSGDNGINPDNLSDISKSPTSTASYCSDVANYLQGWDGVSRGTCHF